VSLGDERAENAAELAAGSTLVLYTDGLVERRGENIEDGLERLRLAAAAGPSDPDALCDHLLEQLLGDEAARDDVALLVTQTAAVAADHLHLELPADPEVLGSVRNTLGRWLRAAGASPEEDRDIQFACHEACSNAIEHGYHFGEASFDVEALRDGGAVSITVRDAGGWKEHVASDRGRGIELMRALMDRVEVSPGPEGTTVTMVRRLGGNGGG
jgi:anti-sigma regulatory factor (Ser/Thr protein kinase)